MDTIKYPIREIDLNCVKINRLLAVNVNETEREFAEMNIRKHGLLTPMVILESKAGEKITVCGETEMQALRNMGISRADVIVSELKEKSDVGKITLLLAGMKKGLSPFTEGLVLKEMLETGSLTQKQLAVKLKKSQGWISKRLALAHNLKETVVELVLAKKICPRSAEEIAKLPEDKQHPFSIELSKLKLTKSSVERLVMAYRKESTPDALKNEIITNPARALLCLDEKFKPRKFKSCADSTKRLDSLLRLFLKLASELEECISKLDNAAACKYTPLLIAVKSACGNLFALVNNIYPGCVGNSLGNNLINDESGVSKL